MQEIKKRRIVIASILKPVNDTRMYEKIGVSLSALYDVHIVGSNTPEAHIGEHTQSIMLHPLGSFRRMSLGRFFAPIRVLRIVLQLKPDLLIVSTHELLATAALARLIYGCTIIYDVQENYARNMYHGTTVPAVLKLPIAIYLRIKEWIFAPIISHFFLSEQSYQDELRFIGQRYTILENKLKDFSSPPSREPHAYREQILLLFSGTIAMTTGVFTAIDVASQLHAKDSRIRLLIMGYAAQTDIRKKIRHLVEDKPFIEIHGLDRLVSHATILDAIKRADFGIISYPPNPSTNQALPTKLFEYMGYQLPILLTHNKRWTDFCAAYQAAVPFDPDDVDAASLLDQMRSISFYTPFPAGVFWSSEEPNLLRTVRSLLVAEPRE